MCFCMIEIRKIIADTLCQQPTTKQPYNKSAESQQRPSQLMALFLSLLLSTRQVRCSYIILATSSTQLWTYLAIFPLSMSVANRILIYSVLSRICWLYFVYFWLTIKNSLQNFFGKSRRNDRPQRNEQ